MNAKFPLRAALAAATALGAEAAEIVSTFDGQGQTPNAWSLDSNWDHVPAAPGNYPNNGMGGNTYDVRINGDLATLSEDITISKLQMTGAAQINSAAHTLTVVQPITWVGGFFLGGGRLVVPSLALPNGMTVSGSGTEVRSSATTLGQPGISNGNLNLNNGAKFVSSGPFTLAGTSSILANAGGGIFDCDGALTKTGPGVSTVSAVFEASAFGASVSVAEGELSFNAPSTWDGVGAAVGAGAKLTFQANATLATFPVNLAAGAEIAFVAGTHTLTGPLTITASGAASATLRGSAKLSGGILLGAQNAPFLLDGGEIGGAGAVENESFFTWRNGLITGPGLLNVADSPRFLVAGVVGGSGCVLRGLLRNQAVIEHRDSRTINLGTGGRLLNESGGVYRVTQGGVFGVESGSTGAEVSNAGVLQLTGGMLTFFPLLTSTGTLRVSAGTLNIQGQGQLGGVLEATAPGALLAFGPAPGSSVTMESATLRLGSGGIQRHASGQLFWRGPQTFEGTGVFEQVAGTGTVSAGFPAQWSKGAETPSFRLNGTAATLRTDDVLTSNVDFLWNAGTLAGTSRLQNNGTVRVTGNATLSAGSGAELRNALSLIVEPGQTLQVGSNGLLVNEAPGTILLTSGADIIPSSGSTGTQLRNSGTVRKASEVGQPPATTPALIRTAYSHTTTAAVLEVQEGDLNLQGANALPGGLVRSSNTGGTGSRALFTGATQLGTVRFEFANDGTIEFPSGTHALSGTLTLAGTGRARLTGGTLQAGSGQTGTVTVNFPATFELSSGTLGGAGTLRLAAGQCFILGGTTAGVLEALAATVVQSGGAVGGTFTARSAYFWSGGSIGGTFATYSSDPPFTVTGMGQRTLPNSTAFTNYGMVRHEGTASVVVGDNAVLTNEAEATYLFTALGTVSPASSNGSSTLVNRGLIQTTATGGNATVSVPLNNPFGTLEAIGGTLRLAGQATVSGGLLKASKGGTVKFERGNFSGTFLHNFTVGTARYELLGGVGALNLAGKFAGAGVGGSIQLASTVDVPAAAEFAGDFGAPVQLVGTLRVAGTATNSGIFESLGGRLLLTAATARFKSGSGSGKTVSLLGSANTTVQASGPEPQFLVDQTSHSGDGHLVFEGDAKWQSLSYFLESDGDILKGTSAANVGFKNVGSFLKSGVNTSSSVTVPFDNQARVTVLEGSLNLNGGVPQYANAHLMAGEWSVLGGSLTFGPQVTIMSRNSALIRLGGTGFFTNLPSPAANFPFTNDGTLLLTANTTQNFGSGVFTNNGKLSVEFGSKLKCGTFTNSSGIFSGGKLLGEGAINGSVIQNGVLAPGNTPGRFTIEGDCTQSAQGRLEIEIDGLEPGAEYDVLEVTGTATLDGTLKVIVLANAVGLPAGSTFTFLSAGQRTGTFATLDLPRDAAGNPLFSVTYTARGARLTALAPLQPAPILAWRQQYFGSSADTGNGADLFDFDFDGLANLLEYALGGDPTGNALAPLPQLAVKNNRLALSFARLVERTDITLTVQGTDDLGTPWTDLARSTAGAAFVMLQPGVEATETGTEEARSVEVLDAFEQTDPSHPQRFLRLVVTRP